MTVPSSASTHRPWQVYVEPVARNEWPESEWTGRGATGFGLHGSVSRCAVIALLNGTHPATGTLLGRAFRESGSHRGSAPSVRGFNATFNAPKSVSVLWAAADARTRDEIIHGHRAAVRAVLSYVERTTSSRARAADEADPLPLPIVGITAATLHLHVSGSGDPHLHSVALITTKVRTLDSRWLALDARPLMREQQTLSRLYHAALQGELASRLARSCCCFGAGLGC